MRITSRSEFPIEQIPFMCAASGNAGVVQRMLPIIVAEVDSLPENLDAIAATSDLQGIDPRNGKLIGHTVAEVLETLADRGKIPPKQSTGIILAGDLYGQTNKRGGAGDVRGVWQAMIPPFRWVAGVAGNHDLFGNSPSDMEAFKQLPSIHYLDGNVTEIDGLRLGGISGIIGKKNKPNRHPEKQFLKTIGKLLKQFPDILILHEGPNDPDARLMGRESIRKTLLNASDLLVICGHCHWKVPMTTLPKGAQVVNVDSRVVVLRSRA